MTLTQNDILLPTLRALFLTEAKLLLKLGSGAMNGARGSLMGAMSDARGGGTRMLREELMTAIQQHAATEERERRRALQEKLKQLQMRTGFASGVDGLGNYEHTASQSSPPHSLQLYSTTVRRNETTKSWLARMHREQHRLESKVIGAWMFDDADSSSGITHEEAMKQLHLMQTLYESRLASLQRLVGFMVLFYRMGKMVQDFWQCVSFGLLGYNMSRTQSILRVASTASPVSGSEVRERMVELGNEQILAWATHQVQAALRFFLKLRRSVAAKTSRICLTPPLDMRV